MFEHKDEPLLDRGSFLLRMSRNFGATLVIVVFSLLVGTGGYCYFGGMSWVDGLLNAAMILTGMGPITPMKSTAGKLFATAYALYSGVAFLTMTAVLLAPVLHRMLHRFHLDDESRDSWGKSSVPDEKQK